jgi:hypothetical protein
MWIGLVYLLGIQCSGAPYLPIDRRWYWLPSVLLLSMGTLAADQHRRSGVEVVEEGPADANLEEEFLCQVG